MHIPLPIWSIFKDSLLRAGFEPWLRPIVETVKGRTRDADHFAALAVIAGLETDAVCVNIGCHKGFYLDPMRRRAARGRFFAFEPIPYLYELLRAKYRNDRRVILFNIALSAANGAAEFFVNAGDMGLSGLSDRPGRTGIDQDRLQRIVVPVRTLDDILIDQRIDFIRIDVEGAELNVLKGACRVLERERPIVLFEFGLGGADYFGVDADAMFDFFDARDFSLFTVTAFAAHGAPFSRNAFRACFDANAAYNFIAAPRD